MRSYYILIVFLFTNIIFAQDISPTGKLKANVVRTANIVDGAVDSSKIKENAVTWNKLSRQAKDSIANNISVLDSSITSAKIATGAVTYAKLADDAKQAITNIALGSQIVNNISYNAQYTDKKRTLYPEAIAYFDVQSHCGFWDGVTVDPYYSDSKIRSRSFFNGNYLKNGDLSYQASYMVELGNVSNTYTATAPDKYRLITNGVVYLKDIMFDLTFAQYDTFNITDSKADTSESIFGVYAGYATWDTSTPTDLSVTFYPTNAAGSWRPDTSTSEYTMVDGEYYVIEWQWTHADSDPNYGGAVYKKWYYRTNPVNSTLYDWQFAAIDTSYKESDNEWFTERVLYKHVAGSYPYFRDVTYANNPIVMRRMKVKHVTNPNDCIFTDWYWATHIRDALGYHTPLVLDTTNVRTDLIYHMKPFQGLNVQTDIQSGYKTFTSGTYTGTSPNFTYRAKVTAQPYSVGDTLFFNAIGTPYTGYKVVTGTATDSVYFNQWAYSAPTDFSGTVWKAEWNTDIGLTFPSTLTTDIVKDVLVVRGSAYRFASSEDETPWSYSEGGSTSKVLLWFDWVDKLSDVKVNYDDYYIGNRVFGVMVFDSELTSAQKIDIMKRIRGEYTKIYKDLNAPQVDWNFDGYFAEKFIRFTPQSKESNFAYYDREPVLFSINDTLWIASYLGSPFAVNDGRQISYEFNNKNALALRYSVDNGDSWSDVKRVVYGVNGVKTAGDTVAVFNRQVHVNGDSAIFMISQIDTVTSNTVNNSGQKVAFVIANPTALYNHPANSSYYRYEDNPEPDNYTGSAGVNSSNTVVRGDTVFFPSYYGYDHYFYKSADNFQTVSKETTYTGDATTGNEWTVVQNGANLLTFARVESGTQSHVKESTDYGKNWTTITPWQQPSDWGKSDPVAAKKLKDGNTLLFFNIGARDSLFLGTTETNGRSIINVSGILGKSNGQLTFPNWAPWDAQKDMSYANIFEGTDGYIHVVFEEGSESNDYLYYLRLGKR